MDDAPGLGGQSDDDAPMISSVQTRVIADARGAYLAGNLDALLDHLIDAQQLQFKRIVLQATVSFINHRIQSGAVVNSVVVDPYIYLQTVQTWIDHPVVEYEIAIDPLILQLQQIQGMRTDATFAISWLLEAQAATRIRSTSQSAISAIVCFSRDSADRGVAAWMGTREVWQHLFERWHLETAWSLLMHRALPDSPPLEEERLRLLMQDRRLLVELKSVLGLINLMSIEQQERLHTLLFRETLSFFERLFVEQKLYEPDHRWLEPLNRWLVLPTELTRESFLAQRSRMPRIMEMDVAYQAICTLTDSFYPGYGGATDDLALRIRNSASKLADAIGYAILASREMRLQALRPDSIEMRAVREWQLNAAWAILHDDPIPPLDLQP